MYLKNINKPIDILAYLTKFINAQPNSATMKKIILLSAFLLCTTVLSAQKYSKDIAAIKVVIEKETKAFFEIDYATWQDQWAHTPYSFWSFADTTDVNFFSGWDEINKGFELYFKTSKPSKAEIDREWISIQVYGKSAYVRFTQKVSDEVISRSKQAEVRFLEKIAGQWKIVNVSVIRKSK